ncbi:Endonuclease/Exonuclease/phosphatase family protein [Pustulibacterium marinum]|uniref:Endonuclease/Exonuclease/phosphatase family protein n=1 Tax=Pustulibacterium marinum TaxID=1224947 RepID=A0A1I7I5F7_9FLAO|nr:endonuclease [Pustulibacterium marinum]SFU68158.1 Endonuclease/Exonuclease/phosphatase family protein [Pustulibacterium marinum]
MKFQRILILVLVIFSVAVNAQEKSYKVRTIAFYNVENLFDTINNPNKYDDDRTPTGKDHWTSAIYKDKIKNMARVIADIGADVTGSAPDILGVAEIENEAVLVDLISDPQLKPFNYGIVHFESPDERGIDVALLYKKNIFTPLSFDNIPLHLKDDDGSNDYTRDQLLVTGILDDEQISFIVNHWPSRSGGEAASRPKREAAAALNKTIIDSLQKINADAKIISMGDLNDDPTNSSMKTVLKTKAKPHKAKGLDLYNPMEEMLKKGLGSLAYRDGWNLFDQIFFTANLLNKEDMTSYRYWQAHIYNKRYLIQKDGRYKGYPFRSYSNGNYTGGYSDHFPVYIYLIKEAK